MDGNLTRAEISEKVIQLFVDIIGFIDSSQVILKSWIKSVSSVTWLLSMKPMISTNS